MKSHHVNSLHDLRLDLDLIMFAMELTITMSTPDSVDETSNVTQPCWSVQKQSNNFLSPTTVCQFHHDFRRPAFARLDKIERLLVEKKQTEAEMGLKVPILEAGGLFCALEGFLACRQRRLPRRRARSEQ